MMEHLRKLSRFETEFTRLAAEAGISEAECMTSPAPPLRLHKITLLGHRPGGSGQLNSEGT